ncbi:hypothetical protein [Paeniglutamicibacter sp.]|uniref:hypothetical protein n=1 Tax=Paeniglutamicibacter sp. TaxID=1934391 RepID=UPI003988B9C6
MSTPENDPLNPEKPSEDPAPPQYGQRATQDPNAAGQPPYGQQPQSGAQPPNPYGQNPNPYGQPAPANNPYGQQPPQAPYGQQPYAGGFPVPPQGNFAPPQMPTHRPKELDTSFWAILAAGVVSLLSTVFGLSAAAITQQMEAFPELEEQLRIAGASMADAIPMIQTAAIVFAVIGLLLYVLIAFMVRKGSGVARIFATIFAVLSLFGIGSGVLMALSVVLGVVGVVFAWLRPSSQFIAARRAARAAGYR